MITVALVLLALDAVVLRIGVLGSLTVLSYHLDLHRGRLHDLEVHTGSPWR